MFEPAAGLFSCLRYSHKKEYWVGNSSWTIQPVTYVFCFTSNEDDEAILVKASSLNVEGRQWCQNVRKARKWESNSRQNFKKTFEVLGFFFNIYVCQLVQELNVILG